MNAKASWDGKKVLLSSFRNEAPFVLEFVAHHKVVGFDEIVIASNDCTDGTAEILDALDAMGVVRHVPCAPPEDTSPQAFAYAEIRRQLPVNRAEWLMVLDADEFLNIHLGAGQLSDLINSQSDGVDLVLINWAWFGSDGHQRWVDEPSSTRFVHRLRTLSGNGVVKSLIRKPGTWKHLSNHHPYKRKGTGTVRLAFAGGLRITDVAADAVTFGAFRHVKPEVGTFRMAQINHYATRTADSFDLRRARGRGAAPQAKVNDRHDDDYFRRMSGGTFLDDTILRYGDPVTKLMASLRQDPRLAQALDHGLHLYQADIARYWQNRDKG